MNFSFNKGLKSRNKAMEKKVYSSNIKTVNMIQALPWNVFFDLWKFRIYIYSMSMNTFKGAYKSSYFGVFWQLLVPTFMFAIFYFVFGQIFGGRFLNNESEGPIDYALALFVGLSFFNFFAANFGATGGLIHSQFDFIKSVSFPIHIVPVVSVIPSFITLNISILLSVLVFLLVKGGISSSIVYLPFILIVILLFTLGITWLFSAIAVFVPDIKAVLGPVSLVMMFMCPIFYPLSMVPDRILWVVKYNPLGMIINNSREVILYGNSIPPLELVWMTFTSLLFFSLGYYVFVKLKWLFGDTI